LSASGEPRSVLIWGGATTVGVYASQLAKKLGLSVVAVAGASAETAKAFGADVVLSYKSAGFEQGLTEAVQVYNIHHVFDTVSEKGTYQLAAKALDANECQGGLIATVLPAQDADSLPKSVTVTLTTSPSVHKPDSPQVEALVDTMVKKAGEWLESGELKVQKVVVIPGGLSGVAEGLQRLQDGKVSGQKLVYRIRETPELA
jgi:NADPH:quinone reductase-like Zn-dependent oxidoreductase